MSCPSCGSAVAPGARFCPSCGSPLGTARPDPVGGRGAGGSGAADPLAGAGGGGSSEATRVFGVPGLTGEPAGSAPGAPPPPSLRVLTPVGGTFEPGATIEVTWLASAGTGATLEGAHVDLVRGTVRLRPIVDPATPLPGTARSVVWRLPPDLPPGEGYGVRVVVWDDYGQAADAFGPGTFSVAVPMRPAPPMRDVLDRGEGGGGVGGTARVDRGWSRPGVEVLTPGAGDAWQVGSEYEIRWRLPAEVAAVPDQVELVLYRRETPLFSMVELGTLIGGARRSYLWRVPRSLDPGGGYRVRVVVRFRDGSVADAFSDGTFSMLPAAGGAWRGVDPRFAAAVIVPIILAGFAFMLRDSFKGLFPSEPTPTPTRAATSTPTLSTSPSPSPGPGTRTPTVARTATPTPRPSGTPPRGTATPTLGFGGVIPPASPTPTSWLDAWLRGTPTVTATRPPGTTSPSPVTVQPTFGAIHFGTDATSDNRLLGETVFFPPATKKVYAGWTYSGMRDGVTWGRVWLKDGMVLADRRSDSTWSGGSEGRMTWSYTDDSGLDTGRYELVLYVEGREIARGSFVVR